MEPSGDGSYCTECFDDAVLEVFAARDAKDPIKLDVALELLHRIYILGWCREDHLN